MTKPTGRDHLLEAFKADGFVAVSGFLSGEVLSGLVEQVENFVQYIVPTLPVEHVYYENKDDPRTLKQVQRMGDHDKWFHKLFVDSPFRRFAERVLGGPVVPKNMQYFNKPPMVGRPTPAHQDGYYFMLDPCEALTMWLALDEVDDENGCVRYVRGSHHNGMREHARTKTLGFSQGIVDFPRSADVADEVPCPASPGDLLAHDALTIHYAEGNQSKERTRRALGFIYYSARAQEDREAHAAYQRKLTSEMRALGKI